MYSVYLCFHHLFFFFRYGCCLCCCCCENRLPPKAQKVKDAFDSIEAYKQQQLDKLRENYTQQVSSHSFMSVNHDLCCLSSSLFAKKKRPTKADI